MELLEDPNEPTLFLEAQ